MRKRKADEITQKQSDNKSFQTNRQYYSTSDFEHDSQYIVGFIDI